MAAEATIARPTGLVDQFAIVAGSHMHVRCVGSGATTVILIAGFNGSGAIWGSIEAPIAEDARVCSYDRFGTGTSDPPTTVQTFTSQASDLRSALQSLGEPGPYVVVGHSFGGAEGVAFASMFPDQVSGLLLLDASPTSWPAAVCAVPGDGSDAARGFAETCAALGPDDNPEHLDAPAAFAEIDAIAPLGALPMAVVTAAAHPYPGLDAGELAHLTDVWNTGQQAWASLSSAGQVLTVADTGHDIQLDQPAAVIDQIHALLGPTR
jgi:pimeloyl-ACP methyl ester carboxylesterase